MAAAAAQIPAEEHNRYLEAGSSVRRRITEMRQRGIKVGTCVRVLCEIEAGIEQVSRPDI